MSGRKAPAASILHLHSTGDAGALQARCIRLISALGAEATHAIAVEGGGRLAGAERLHRSVAISWPAFPSLAGKPWPGRLKRLAAAMAGHRLICTWGAGALDATLAHTLFADAYNLPPLVHHEGEGADSRSTMMRRIALGRSAALVVPSRALERLALGAWQQPRTRVRLIPEGIDTAAFATTLRPDGVPGLIKRRGEWWLGTFAPPDAATLRPLMEALRQLPPEWQLVVAGDALPREAILAQAEASGVEDRVHSVALPPALERLIGLFDLFGATSPELVKEAMAAGLAVVAPRIEGIDELVASENAPFLVDSGDGVALAGPLRQLAADRAMRHRIGEANRARARAEFDKRRMVERHLALWRGLLAPA